MQGWSRMAALMFAAGAILVAGTAGLCLADDGKNQEAARAKGTIDLRLSISGLKSDRAEVEISPGNGGSSFEIRTLKVAEDPKGEEIGLVSLWVRKLSVSTDNPTRECSIAITIKEPGRPERFTRRGFRLSNSAATDGQRVDLYLDSSALIAKSVDETRKTK